MKKTITLLLTLCMFVSLFSGMAFAANETGVPTAEAAEAQIAEDAAPAAEAETPTEEAASAAEAVEEAAAAEEAEPAETVDRGTDVHRVFHSDFYIAPNADAGLTARVNVSLDLGGSTGKLYLPGKADASQLFFSWEDDGLTVQLNGTKYASGTAPVPQPGKSLTYKVTRGAALALVTIKTVQGSADVEPMFLELDEGLGTIDAMNGDESHETSCYGKAMFDGLDKPISIKGRGNSTWKFDKKPYNITFYKKADFDKKDSVSLVDGVKAKKWSLIANYLDNSLLRNKVAMDLADALGIGLKTRLIDVWMNGEYLGTYLLTPKNDYDAPKGGYALENDNYLDDEDPQFEIPGMVEVSNYVLDKGYYNRITVKDIGDDAGVDVSAIEDYFLKAWAALEDFDSEDYQNYFDMDSWAKMFLMYEVSKTYDCYAGSLLMHRDGLTDSDKLEAGPAWDYDVSFGRTLHKFFVGITEDVQLNAEGWYVDSIGLIAVDKPVSLLQELGKHASFMQHVAKVYTENIAAFNDIVPNVDSLQTQVRASALMNNARWGTQSLCADYLVSPTTMRLLGTGKYNLNYQITATWDNYVHNLREFASKRVMWLTDHLYTEVPAGAISVSEDGYSLRADLTAGSANASYQWQRLDGENWVDVEGATAAVYAPKLGSGEAQYRCVVTNAGPVISTVHGGKVTPAAATTLDAVTFTAPVSPDFTGKYTNVRYNCYTAIGDSISWGYGVDPEYDHANPYLFGARVPGSFTDLVARVLEANNPDVVIHPASSSGARLCDFRILLERGMGVENPYDRVNDWYGDRHPERTENLRQMGPEVVSYLRESDLVTVQLGINDLSTALSNAAIATGVIDMDKLKNLSDLDGIADYISTAAQNLAKDPNVLGNLISRFNQEVTEIRTNAREVIKDVVELTPDGATILIVGYHKAVQDIRTVPGTDFSVIFSTIDTALVSLNDYMEGIAAEYPNVHYVDAPDAEVFYPSGTSLTDLLKDTDKILWGVHPNGGGHAYIAECVLTELEELSQCRHTHTTTETTKIGIGTEYVSSEICDDCGKVLSSAKVTTPVGDLPVPELTVQSMLTDVKNAFSSMFGRLGSLFGRRP